MTKWLYVFLLVCICTVMLCTHFCMHYPTCLFSLCLLARCHKHLEVTGDSREESIHGVEIVYKGCEKV